MAGEAGWEFRLPPLDDEAWQGEADVTPVDAVHAGGEVVEWTIQASQPQERTLDLRALGVDLSRYDAIACDMYLIGSDSAPVLTLHEWPESGEMSNWYAKIRRPLETWIHWRCDLRLDDDGVWLGRGYAARKDRPDHPELVFKFTPRFLRFEGEPAWRKLRVANLRLIRYPLAIDFSKREARYSETDTEYVTEYDIRLTGRTETPGTAVLEADTSRLAYHRAAFVESGAPAVEIPLAPGETKTVTLRFAIDKTRAEMLPPLFAESVSLAGRMKEVSGVTVRPLMGYRPWNLWAAVPATLMRPPRPAETMAETEALLKMHPKVKEKINRAVRRGRKILKKTHEVLTRGPSGHNQSYLCQDCQKKLKPIDVDHHKCPKCGKIITDPVVIKAYLRIRHSEYMKDVSELADAYQHSGDEAFAMKAKNILLQYADKYDEIVSVEPRSTSSQSNMCGTTLGEAFATWGVHHAYHRLTASPSFTDEERRHIEKNFLLNSALRMMAHGAEMNQRAEYFKCFGSAGLYCRAWALAGEAIYGPQGFLSLFDDGFSADGIAQEGGGYHRATMHSMGWFARIMHDQGINLYSPRLKRIFDGSVAVSPTGVSRYCPSEYEMAYRMYRDPKYLPTLKAVRKKPRRSILEGVPGLPPSGGWLGVATNLPGTGLLFLRRNASDGHRCLAINYGSQWERSEKDRLHFHLYADGKRLSRQIGRITYGSPFSHNMYRSFGHNIVTVDGADLLEERVELAALDEQEGVAAALFRVRPEAPLYPGVDQCRLVAIVENHFLVIDRLRSETGREYAWHYYPVAKERRFAIPMEPVETPPTLSEHALPEKSLGACRAGRVRDALLVQYKDGPVPVTLVVRSDGPMDVLDGMIMQHYRPWHHPFLRVTRSGAPEATFVALYWIGDSPDKPTTHLVRGEGEDGSDVWYVNTDEARYTVSYHPGGGKARFRDRTADGPLLVIRKPRAK